MWSVANGMFAVAVACNICAMTAAGARTGVHRPPNLDALCSDWKNASVLDVTAPLASLRGSALAGSADVLSVGALTFPPYVIGTSSYYVEGPPLTDPQRPGHGEPGFPDSGTGFTGRLLVGGAPVVPLRSRWCAHRVEREGTAALPAAAGGGVLVVRTAVSLAAESRGVLFDIAIDSAEETQTPAAAAVEVQLEMQGIVRMFNGSNDWQFGHNTTHANQTQGAANEFAQVLIKATNTSTSVGTSASASASASKIGVAVTDKAPPCGGAASAFLLSRAPDTIDLAPVIGSSSGVGVGVGVGVADRLVGARATFALRVGGARGGKTPQFRLGVVLGVGANAAEAEAVARGLGGGAGLPSFAAGMRAAQRAWQRRWDAAFTPGNAHYSGHLPTLDANRTDEDGSGGADVARMYYHSVLSFLSIERTVADTHTQTDWTRAYATGGPRTGVTADYFWDEPYQSTLLSLLDPAYVRRYVLRALSNSTLDTAYEINYMSGRGEGRRYSFNELSLFTLVDVYTRISGDTSLLWEPLAVAAAREGPREAGVTTVLCALHALATHYRQLPQYAGLTDYGENMNLLECVPQYQHAVPALNAANVWMLRELAQLDDLLLAAPVGQLPGRLPACVSKGTPAALRSAAAAIQSALQPMYVRGAGYWRSLQPDGVAAPAVRTIIDFHTIGSLLGAPAGAVPAHAAAAAGSLSDAQRREMSAFALAELATPDWMRALSLLDDAANVSSFRPDHGAIGSYDAWPAQAMDALLTMGRSVDALRLLRRIAAGNGGWREGPLGQAHILLSNDPRDTSDNAAFHGRRLCNSTTVPTARCHAYKSGVWMMQSLNAASAAFANTILRSFLGFQPPLPFGVGRDAANAANMSLYEPGVPRGFRAVLCGVSLRGKLWDVVSDADAGIALRASAAMIADRKQ